VWAVIDDDVKAIVVHVRVIRQQMVAAGSSGELRIEEQPVVEQLCAGVQVYVSVQIVGESHKNSAGNQIL
jgi:hypothetical protein